MGVRLMARARRATPASPHYDLLDERSFEAVARAVQLLEERGAAYVLVGGWAVYAYGSRVPSVDTDVLLEQADFRDIAAMMEGMGVSVGAGRQFEAMQFDAPSAILGPDPDLQEPDRGYVPRTVLRGRTVRRELDLGRHGRPIVSVPTADALAFMKLKAYHNRELQWRAHRDPAVMARIPTSDRGQVLGKTEGYFLRKAGKDVYDIAFLLSRHATVESVRAILRETGLEADLLPLLRNLPEAPLLLFARSMADEERDEATLARLREWGTS